MTAYKNVRNQATTLNRELKKQHFAEKIAKEKGNMKGTWKIINQLVNKRSKSTNISCLSVNGNQISDSSKIANSMNDYFCSIGNDLASEIPDKQNPLLNRDYSVNMNSAAFCFKEINPQDVSKAIGEFKSSTSFGVDMISIYFLKIALHYISLPLAFIFNASLRACNFPDAWELSGLLPFARTVKKSKIKLYISSTSSLQIIWENCLSTVLWLS